MTNRKGFFEGMPDGMKIRLFAWIAYFVLCGFFFLNSPILGGAMFLLPLFWFVSKNWVLAFLGGRTDLERSDTAIGYTLDYLFFHAPVPVRILSGLAAVAIVVFGLGWVSTENLRLKAAEPTFSERISTATGDAIDATKEKTGELVTSAGDATSAAVDATKETTNGLWSKAKDWWAGDENAPAE